MCRRTFTVPYDAWSHKLSLEQPPVYPQGELLNLSFNRHTGNIIVTWNDSVIGQSYIDSIFGTFIKYCEKMDKQYCGLPFDAIFHALESKAYDSPQVTFVKTHGEWNA